MNGIPDDGTMESALYGSAHVETVLARENAEKMLRIFEDRIRGALSELDLDLAEEVCRVAPELIHSEEALDPLRWPPEIVDAVEMLRYIKRQSMGEQIVRSWTAAADHRGRLIGMGEHSARASVSGKADADYKAAAMWGGRA